MNLTITPHEADFIPSTKQLYMKGTRMLLALFRPKTELEMAQEEFEQAKRSLLKAQTGRDWAESQIEYNRRVISRLSAFLKKESESE